MLTPEQLAARENKLTASRVAALMTGNEDDIMGLWREMVGDPSFVPVDLSGVWPVRLGECTESLNLAWFERKHGALELMGAVVVHKNTWAAATLDGWSVALNAPVECKHVGGREPLETIIERYMPQMHWQMIVTGATRCALSVIMGANEPVVEIIEKDEAYAAELMRRAEAFMQCVWELRPPFAEKPVTPPVKAEIVYDMQSSNSWADNAATWLATRQAKEDCVAAEKELKAMVPADAVRCHSHGVEIKRNRAGSLSLREMNT